MPIFYGAALVAARRRGTPRRLRAVIISAGAAVAVLGAFASQAFGFASLLPAAAPMVGRLPRHLTSQATSRGGAVARAASFDDEDAYDIEDATAQELALDVRELLITDGNIFFIGPDTQSNEEEVRGVADLLNYTFHNFYHTDLRNATLEMGSLERVYLVPPLLAAQRWPWCILHHGLIVWLDPDGYKHLNVYERDRIYKLKNPVKISFGPEKPWEIMKHEGTPPADPIDMWMEGDVHVDVRGIEGVPLQSRILGKIVNAILKSPPKWRGWFKEAKARGTIDQDFQTPLQVRREFHSYGVSPRLNKLLNA